VNPLPTLVWINGRKAPVDAAHVSVTDRGFTLGDGVFETMLVRRGRAFRLAAHRSRLGAGLNRLAIGVPPALDAAIATALAAARDVEAAMLRVTVSRGPGMASLGPVGSSEPSSVVLVAPLPEFGADTYEHGLTAHVASGRRNERSMTAGLKTLAYTESVAALVEARSAGANEALFLDMEGHCSEASASNLFIVVGDRLVTPPPSCGALPGITRAAVLEVARAAGLIAAERAMTLADLLAADEAFLTSSLRGIAPLVVVARTPIGSGRPGPATARLREGYAALVARECGD